MLAYVKGAVNAEMDLVCTLVNVMIQCEIKLWC